MEHRLPTCAGNSSVSAIDEVLQSRLDACLQFWDRPGSQSDLSRSLTLESGASLSGSGTYGTSWQPWADWRQFRVGENIPEAMHGRLITGLVKLALMLYAGSLEFSHTTIDSQNLCRPMQAPLQVGLACQCRRNRMTAADESAVVRARGRGRPRITTGRTARWSNLTDAIADDFFAKSEVSGAQFWCFSQATSKKASVFAESTTKEWMFLNACNKHCSCVNWKQPLWEENAWKIVYKRHRQLIRPVTACFIKWILCNDKMTSPLSPLTDPPAQRDPVSFLAFQQNFR